MFSIKDLDVALADIKNTNVIYMAVKDLLFWPTGGSQTARLPVAYQEVEYIQANGSQYIDTGYAPNNNTKIYAKFAHGATQNQGPLFGARGRSGYTEYNYQYILWSHSSEYNQGGTAMDNKPCPLFCHEYNTSSTSGGIKFLDTRYPAGTVIEFEYDKNGGYYGPDNTWTWSPAANTASINMLIFGLREGTTIDSRKFDGKLFAFKVWESGVAKRDFVPCYRKEDGEIGLYDLVNNEFYNNKGSGRFTRGKNVNVISLPSGYTQIQYIQSVATNPGTTTSSGQYIDTLYTPNQYTKIAIDMQFQNLTRQSRLFAIHDTNTSYMTIAAYINGSDKWARAMKNGEGDWVTTEVAVDTGRHTFTLKNGNYKINTGNTVNYNASNGSTSSTSARHTLPLLAAWDFAENKIVDHSSAKIFGCTIFEKEEMVRNFVPCISKYGEVGLYDLVEGKFYGNAGTGNFIAGSSVLFVPDEDTLIYYDFENNMLDTSSRGNNVVASGNVGYYEITPKQSVIKITAAKGGLKLPPASMTPVGTGDFTIVFWAYLVSQSDGGPQIFGLWSDDANSNNPGPNIFFHRNGTNVTSFRMLGGSDDLGEKLYVNDPRALEYNKRHLWSMIRRNGVVYCYIDADLLGSFASTRNINYNVSTDKMAFLGRRDALYDGDSGWNGQQLSAGAMGDMFIAEKGGWSEEKLREQYNKTKWLFQNNIGKKDISFCDYIESTGTQWIDTGLTGAQADDVEMEFSFPSQPSAVAVPMGVRGDNSAADSVIRINESNIIEPRFGSGISTGVKMLAKTKYKVRTEFKSGAQKVYVNDVQKATGSLAYTYNASRTYYLFAFHDASEISCKCSCRMYSCKVKLGDTVVRNFVPCFVKYTGEAGMWDTVNEKFYPNIGTGSFGKGFNKFSPEDYQKVEYVQSSSSGSGTSSTGQYINTGYNPNNKTKVEFKVGNWTNTGKSSNDLFASDETFTVNGFGLLAGWYNFYSGVTFAHDFNDTNIHIGEFSQQGLYKDGQLLVTPATHTFQSNTPLCLFALNRNGTISEHSTARLYYFKIYDDGELVRDFIPCYRIRDGVIGLYDTVNDYFYTNLGSGSFTKGKNVYEKKDLVFCDYIQSTGTQYIDTGFKGNQNTAFETKVRMLGTNSQNQQWLGGDLGNTTSNSLQIVFRTPGTSDGVNNRFGGSLTVLYSSDTGVGVDYIVHTDKNGFILNGVSKTRTGTVGTFTTENNMRLFQVKNKNNTEGLIGRMYYAKIWDDGNLIRNFKPCYIKKTGEAGLWDEVEQKFYGNDGTGAFYRGNEGGLPSLYRQVTFIKSNAAGQHIDTGVTTNGADNTEMEGEVAFYTDTSYDTAFGKKGRIWFFFGVIGASNETTSIRKKFRGGGNDKYGYTSLINDYRKHTFKISTSSPVLYIDGVAYNVNTQSSTSSTSSAKIGIFGAQYASGSTVNWEDAALSAVYSFKIRRNGELIRDFVPCYRKTDGVIGLYDLVTGGFYTNGGSGTLDKGDDV